MPTTKGKKIVFSPESEGFSKAQWDKGKAEMLDILTKVAARQKTIFYSELSQSLGSIHIEPHGGAMASMLGQISEDEDGKGRGMLSVLVVHKTGEQTPGKGFYKCAVGLGKDVSDPDGFWIAELKRVHEYWSNSNLGH
jgi:hypothetical protein